MKNNVFDGFYGIDPETEELGLGFFKKLRRAIKKKAKKVLKVRKNILKGVGKAAKNLVKSTVKFAKSDIGKVAISAALGLGAAALAPTGVGAPLALKALNVHGKISKPKLSLKSLKIFNAAKKASSVVKRALLSGKKLNPETVNRFKAIEKLAVNERNRINQLNIQNSTESVDIRKLLSQNIQTKMRNTVTAMKANGMSESDILKSYLTSSTFRKQSLPATLDAVKDAIFKTLVGKGVDPITAKTSAEAEAPIIAKTAVDNIQKKVGKSEIKIDPELAKKIFTGVGVAILVKKLTE